MEADPFDNVAEVTERLEEEYPSSNLRNKERPFDELVYIVLANRTREEYYQRAFGRVKDLVKDWNQLLDVEDEDLAAAIGDAGLDRKKARNLLEAPSLLPNSFVASIHTLLTFFRHLEGEAQACQTVSVSTSWVSSVPTSGVPQLRFTAIELSKHSPPHPPAPS